MNSPLPDLDPHDIDAVRMSMIPGIGPRTFSLLIEAFGDPGRVLAAAPSQLRNVEGVGPKLAAAIANASNELDVEAEINRCRENGIGIVSRSHETYPGILNEIPDPPSVLYCRGQLLKQDELAIAIVGTRHASRYGLAQAEQLAAGLARAGYTIVSGLARGIDGAAHRAALAAGGRTLAVLGGGILKMYPAEHQELADQVSQCGSLLSEYPSLFPPKSSSFPRRNRIVTGLSLGVVVVEAGERSGALISARLANEQGREVFAVPGRVDSRNSRGCHRLIRDGAKLVESIDDIIEELGPLATPVEDSSGQRIHHPGELQLNEQERRVLQAIGTEPTEIDAVVAATGLPVGRVLGTISVLEMRRLIQRLGGTSVSRN